MGDMVQTALASYIEILSETYANTNVLDNVSIVQKRMQSQDIDSFKYVESILKGKGLCHKRISVERNLFKEVLIFEGVIELF